MDGCVTKTVLNTGSLLPRAPATWPDRRICDRLFTLLQSPHDPLGCKCFKAEVRFTIFSFPSHSSLYGFRWGDFRSPVPERKMPKYEAQLTHKGHDAASQNTFCFKSGQF